VVTDIAGGHDSKVRKAPSGLYRRVYEVRCIVRAFSRTQRSGTRTRTRTRGDTVLAAVSTAIEYEYRFAEYRFAEYRFAEYRFAEYEHGEIRCDARTFIVDRSRLRGPRLPC
jgi:hypothetical protein